MPEEDRQATCTKIIKDRPCYSGDIIADRQTYRHSQLITILITKQSDVWSLWWPCTTSGLEKDQALGRGTHPMTMGHYFIWAYGTIWYVGKIGTLAHDSRRYSSPTEVGSWANWMKQNNSSFKKFHVWLSDYLPRDFAKAVKYSVHDTSVRLHVEVEYCVMYEDWHCAISVSYSLRLRRFLTLTEIAIFILWTIFFVIQLKKTSATNKSYHIIW